jgi:hypothetical protein
MVVIDIVADVAFNVHVHGALPNAPTTMLSRCLHLSPRLRTTKLGRCLARSNLRHNLLVVVHVILCQGTSPIPSHDVLDCCY